MLTRRTSRTASSAPSATLLPEKSYDRRLAKFYRDQEAKVEFQLRHELEHELEVRAGLFETVRYICNPLSHQQRASLLRRMVASDARLAPLGLLEMAEKWHPEEGGASAVADTSGAGKAAVARGKRKRGSTAEDDEEDGRPRKTTRRESEGSLVLREGRMQLEKRDGRLPRTPSPSSRPGPDAPLCALCQQLIQHASPPSICGSSPASTPATSAKSRTKSRRGARLRRRATKEKLLPGGWPL